MNEDQCCDCQEASQERTCAEPEGVIPATGLIPKHHINIESLNRGFIVRVGCQSFAVSSKQELIKLFTAYILDPVKVETNWMKEGKLPE